MDRRRLIAGAAATAVAIPAGALAKETLVSLGKIDTHQHYFPKVYVDAVGLEHERIAPVQAAPCQPCMRD